jgi:hypothetical protein
MKTGPHKRRGNPDISAGLRFAFYQKKFMKKAFWLIMAGIGIGILLAPRKGSETWEKIVDGIDDWKSKAMDTIDDLKSGGENMVAEGKKTASRAQNEW